MYGVVEIGGHQYRVQAGDILDVQKLSDEVNSTIELDQVLFVGGDNVAVGTPTVKGAKVTAKIVRHDRDRKIIVFKRKPGAYKRKNGHRQHYTSLLITELSDGQGNTAKIDKDSNNAKKFLK
jgi:large subunit ribosomal protein L21